MTSPPRLARWMVAAFVREPLREFLLGDLDEQFADPGERRRRPSRSPLVLEPVGEKHRARPRDSPARRPRFDGTRPGREGRHVADLEGLHRRPSDDPPFARIQRDHDAHARAGGRRQHAALQHRESAHSAAAADCRSGQAWMDRDDESGARRRAIARLAARTSRVAAHEELLVARRLRPAVRDSDGARRRQTPAGGACDRKPVRRVGLAARARPVVPAG